MQHEGQPLIEALERQPIEGNGRVAGIDHAVNHGDLCLQAQLLCLAEHFDGQTQLHRPPHLQFQLFIDGHPSAANTEIDDAREVTVRNQECRLQADQRPWELTDEAFFNDLRNEDVDIRIWVEGDFQNRSAKAEYGNSPRFLSGRSSHCSGHAEARWSNRD